MIQTYFAGFSLGLSLLVAIGAQNAFVLRQGLSKAHVFATASVCACSDAVLIMAGVLGFGQLVGELAHLAMVMNVAGAGFLLVYGLLKLKSGLGSQALNQNTALKPAENGAVSLTSTLLTCLAFTWLNPHVYLDTVVLVGSVSAHYGAGRNVFGLGAVSASFLFFFALAYGARLLTPVFARPFAWKVLDVVIGLVMLYLSFGLMRQSFG